MKRCFRTGTQRHFNIPLTLLGYPLQKKPFSWLLDLSDQELIKASCADMKRRSVLIHQDGTLSISWKPLAKARTHFPVGILEQAQWNVIHNTVQQPREDFNLQLFKWEMMANPAHWRTVLGGVITVTWQYTNH